MAGLLNAAPADLTIVSCGTESINWCLRGAALQAKADWGGSHIMTSAVEHDAVLETVSRKCGCECACTFKNVGYLR